MKLDICAKVLAILCTGGVFLDGVPGTQAMQAVIEIRPVNVTPTRPVAQERDEPDAADPERKYLGGAPLKTDPDLMERLKKAEAFRKDGNYRVASRLWQSVLGESGDVLSTEDGETYYALREKVESILAESSPEGLAAYRISADASARELMAQRDGEFDIETLNQVVKQYFMSSLGDEAAYRLARIYLDQYDFVGAARLLKKIVNRYPDPSVPMDQVWLRLGIAYTYIGNLDSARQALASAKEAGADPSSQLFEAVAALVDEAPRLNPSTGQAAHWVTRLGNARRYGVMPALPQGYDQQNLKADWQFFFQPRNKYVKQQYAGEVIDGFDPREIADSVGRDEEELIQRWRKGMWRPANLLLINDQFVVFKTGSDITVWDRRGELSEQPAWRPLWLNQFTIDKATQTWNQVFDMYGRGRANSGRSKSAPADTREIQLFGDQIAQSMSIHQGVLYTIEGKQYSWNDDRPPSINRSDRYNHRSVPRRTRTNHLTAYDLDSGKVLWRVPTIDLLENASGHNQKAEEAQDNADADPWEDIGLMAAPVGFGDLLLVPVNVSGSIWIYALDSSNQGELVWRSFLCDEPGGGSEPWSPIHLSVEGSTAFVSCGTGVVFSLDPMTGSIRFARRYQRTGESNNFMERYGGNAEVLELDGWSEDLVLPVGDELVLMASDFSSVWTIDRESAKFQWKTENRPFGEKFDYLIGVYDDMIYLGGNHTVAAISISAEGRWEWVHNLGEDVSYGRGMITPGGVYVPVEDRIIKFALKDEEGSGKILQEMRVRLGTGAPVGNLYSDGQRIWVAGANRLYALGADEEPVANDADESDDDAPSVDSSEELEPDDASME